MSLDADLATLRGTLNEICLDSLETTVERTIAEREWSEKQQISSLFLKMADGLDRLEAEFARLRRIVGQMCADSLRKDAEIARLRQENEDGDKALAQGQEAFVEQGIRLVAAEREVARLIDYSTSLEKENGENIRLHREDHDEVARLREGLTDAVDVAIWLTGAADLSDAPAWPEMREKLSKARALLAEDGGA